jgi:hypothetical protein
MAEEDPRPSVDVSATDVSPLIDADAEEPEGSGGVENKLWWKITHL